MIDIEKPEDSDSELGYGMIFINPEDVMDDFHDK